MTRLNLIEGTDEYCIAGLAMKVRSELGFSMLESTYERALMIELKNAGFPAERQVSIPVFYNGETLNHGTLRISSWITGFSWNSKLHPDSTQCTGDRFSSTYAQAESKADC